MLRSQRRGRDPPCWLSEKEPLVGKRRVNFQRCWLPVSRIGLHRRGVERVNCGPKLLDLGEKGVYSSYTSYTLSSGTAGDWLTDSLIGVKQWLNKVLRIDLRQGSVWITRAINRLLINQITGGL